MEVVPEPAYPPASGEPRVGRIGFRPPLASQKKSEHLMLLAVQLIQPSSPPQAR